MKLNRKDPFDIKATYCMDAWAYIDGGSVTVVLRGTGVTLQAKLTRLQLQAALKAMRPKRKKS